MITVELAECIKDMSMYELAQKTLNPKMSLTDSEKTVVADLDSHFKAIGKKGYDEHHEIASFMEKVINEVIYDEPDELLDELFDRGTIGELDDFQATKTPKNTLIAYEAAKGGNVNRSFLDISVMTPIYKNYQIETDISYADIEKNGWKTIALYTDYAVAAFKNKLFKFVFDTIDAGITSGAANYISAGAATVSQAAMDAAALYIQDRAGYGNGNFVALSKYVQQASKLTGFTSDEMINEVHRTGRAGVYDGVSMTPISAAKKLGNGDQLIIDKRIFGIAGKLGVLNMKGEIKAYQDEDNNKEKFHLMFKNFSFALAFTEDTLENVVKIELS